VISALFRVNSLTDLSASKGRHKTPHLLGGQDGQDPRPANWSTGTANRRSRRADQLCQVLGGGGAASGGDGGLGQDGQGESSVFLIWMDADGEQYWDMRTPNPIAQLTAPERVYALDAVNDLMVCRFSSCGNSADGS
jgi:hypothetical protein